MSRRDIYYWKCDRPAAFHGTQTRGRPDAEIEQQLREVLRGCFDARTIVLSTGVGQGNHLTWNADVDGVAMFIRVENGPEKDDHLAVESALIDQVRATGVPTPRVHGCDATRNRVPFAWQVLERIAAPDLNHWFKLGTLDLPHIAFDIGAAVARWQSIALGQFGPVVIESRAVAPQLQEPPVAAQLGCFSSFHVRYEDYFRLRLDQHLGFLVERKFLTSDQRGDIEGAISDHLSLLKLESGCFVHKDLALWNVLGTRDHIAAFIDFDDAISGDPMDDLSLLACFHDAAFVNRAFEGYQSLRPLPPEHRRRFWLHLLRNMIVKSVIRVGAGYFDRSDSFFLIGSGSSGQSLREFTLARLQTALRGLRGDCDIATL